MPCVFGAEPEASTSIDVAERQAEQRMHALEDRVGFGRERERRFRLVRRIRDAIVARQRLRRRARRKLIAAGIALRGRQTATRPSAASPTQPR